MAAISRALLLVGAGFGGAALVAWFARRERPEQEQWFEGEGVVRAGPPVDAPEPDQAGPSGEAAS